MAIAENDHFGTSSAVSQVSFQPVSHLGSSQLPGSSTNELMATIQQRKFLDFFPQSNGCTSVASSVSDSNSSTPTLGHGSTNQHVVDRELEKLKQKLAGSRFFTGDILIDHQMPMDSVSSESWIISRVGDSLNSTFLFSAYSHATIETGSISTTNTDLRRAVVDGLTSRRLLNNPSYMENISVKPRETSEFHGLRPSQTVPTLHKLNQPTTSTTESSNVIPKVSRLTYLQDAF